MWILSGEHLETRLCMSAVGFATRLVAPGATPSTGAIFPADLDGDGDADIVYGDWTDGATAWLENVDGRLQEVRSQSIARLEAPWALQAADVDGDGDLDVLSVSYTNNTVSWFENVDGRGNFGEQRIVTTTAIGVRLLLTADIDNDRDVDVICGADAINENTYWIAWFENRDGQGDFGGQTLITDRVTGLRSLDSGDIDGDGDTDLLSASTGTASKVLWYENLNGQGRFAQPKVVTTDALSALSVHSADLDGDDDLDVLSASYSDDEIAWYENTDGRGHFGSQVFISVVAGGARWVRAVDLDGDTDMDVLSGASSAQSGISLAWYENTDGLAHFSDQRMITTGPRALGLLFAADLDHDSNVDVLSAPWGADRDQFSWYENRLIGDVNDDGRFESGDLVQVFQAGEYEDDVVGNSSFEEGDWNGDAEFDSADMVIAFQPGHYEAIAQAVPILEAAVVDEVFICQRRNSRRDLATDVIAAHGKSLDRQLSISRKAANST
jgi:hypothetical protein